MNKKLLFLLTGIMFLGCENPDPKCDLPTPAISVNGENSGSETVTLEILNNGSFQLDAVGYDDAEYEWTGPNGFTSDLKNPVIANVTTAMSGDYQVSVNRGICSGENKISIAIDAPVINCTPQNNRLTFSGPVSITAVNFNSIYTSSNSGNYTMYANGSNGDLTIIFSTETAPETGVYRVSSECPSTSSQEDELCMTLNYSGYFCRAQAGSELYVTKQPNGKYVVVFCDVTFNPVSEFPVELIGSAQITEM